MVVHAGTHTAVFSLVAAARTAGWVAWDDDVEAKEVGRVEIAEAAKEGGRGD